MNLRARPILMVVLLVDALVAGAVALAVVAGAPVPLALLIAIALLPPLVTGAVVVARRDAPVSRAAVRLDLDRLRRGRLRDACLRAAGYHRQIQALAETFPDAAWRTAIARDLPVVDAALRALHDLCLALQAYEVRLGEPAAEAAAPAAEAEHAIQATLDAFQQVYGALRQAWSAPAHPADCPCGALAPHATRLRELATALAAPVEPATC